MRTLTEITARGSSPGSERSEAPSGAEQLQGEDWKAEIVRLLRKRSVIYGLLSLLLIVVARAGFIAWSHRSAGIKDITVSVIQTSAAPLDDELKLPANIIAIEQASLYSHISGYLKKLYVDEGDHVKKDQLLAVIDAPDAVQEYNKAKADYDLKEVTLKRYVELLSQQVVSQQEYDQVSADANEAKARLDNAAANVSYTRITAPFEGSIARRFNYTGDLINGNPRSGANPIFILVNESEVRVVVNVPQIDVAKMEVGGPVDIQVDSVPGKVFKGTITRIDALLDDATKTQRVLIDVPNKERELRAGMFATVVLHIAHHDNAIMIPDEAIEHDGNNAYVFTVVPSGKPNHGTIKKTAVTVGMTNSSEVEITSGLRVGDEILARTSGLADGTAVRVGEINGKAVP